MTQRAELPYGSSSMFTGLSETFAFHSSPESFITSRVLAFRAQYPDIAESRVPIRARVLNRNVAVISSYRHVQQLLCDEASRLSASKAYEELMAPFFPPPNLLLTDPPDHQHMKDDWDLRMDSIFLRARDAGRSITLAYFRDIEAGSPIDLYSSMKDLAWKLLIKTFLMNDHNEEDSFADHGKLVELQEHLLRGQFSLFPVSLSLMGWSSPRAKGLAARKELQGLLKDALEAGNSKCPFSTKTSHEKQDVAAHLLLFTSSLAVKALASLLTAVILNLYVHDCTDPATPKLVESLRSITDLEHRQNLTRSIILETERLSPPVVGIMRRTEEDLVLDSLDSDGTPNLIPKGWDTWIYFVGAARDPSEFGSTSEIFSPERYQSAEPPAEGLAFGLGPKGCLGQQVVRLVVGTVVETLVSVHKRPNSSEATVDIECDQQDLPAGVQGWLGMQAGVKPEDWARDMKQLPTQHPTKPIMVKVKGSVAT